MKSRRAALQSLVLGSLGIAAVPDVTTAKKKKKTCPVCPPPVQCPTTPTPSGICNATKEAACRARDPYCTCGTKVGGGTICFAEAAKRYEQFCDQCRCNEVCVRVNDATPADGIMCALACD